MTYTDRNAFWRCRFSGSFSPCERAMETRQRKPRALAYPEKVHAHEHEQDLSPER
jgi:hypothetical protein